MKHEMLEVNEILGHEDKNVGRFMFSSSQSIRTHKILKSWGLSSRSFSNGEISGSLGFTKHKKAGKVKACQLIKWRKFQELGS